MSAPTRPGTHAELEIAHPKSQIAAPRSALVIGGGLAGMSCALRLAEHGVAVTILETRKKLGGRATSFQDVRTGQWLDNCQHVVLGCCTNYLDFLGRLGAAGKIVWHKEQYWIEPGARVSVIQPGLLPAPLHFTRSFLNAPFLTFGEKRQIGEACRRILKTDRTQWGGRTFAAFLASCAQSERVVRRFWSPVVVSACNLDVDRVAASSALHVFQEGFLANKAAADIGVPGVPLLDLYDNAAATIERAGGRVLFGAGVKSIDEQGATTTDGERFTADAVVCAVPVERVNRIVDEAVRARDDRFSKLDQFTHSPILGVHMTFDRPVLPVTRSNDDQPIPHAVLVDRPTQWLFRKDGEGKSIHAVISAADAWVPLSEEQIADKVLADLRACLPAFAAPPADQPKLLTVRAVKEKLATFAPTPGVEPLRPAATGASRLILAGDYTQTGWPATMEGAVRSGYAAAAAVLGVPAPEFVTTPLKVARLARLAGLRG